MTKPETLGEVHIMFQNLLEQVKTLTTHLEENTGTTKEVLTQVTKTNGRVTSLEGWQGKTDSILDRQNDSIISLKGDRKWLLGAAAVIIVLAGMFPYFLTLWVKEEIRGTLAEFDIVVE